MTDQNLKYNILVIDDDLLVLEDAVLMYKDMIFLGDFDDILGKDAEGSVSSAKNTKEAEKILQANFEEHPKLVQVLHVDERMPGERGSEFVDRMRWAYAGRRIGALLVTGYATDVSVINSREKGVYRYVSKPVTPALIKPHLADLVKVIFSKEKPKKREITDTFVFKHITDKEQLVQYFQLRYSVFDFMNYLQQKNDQRLDIDKFDPYSIPYGGFLLNDDGSETIVASIRTITTELQEPYNQMIREIARGGGRKRNSNIIGGHQN
jgi:response regulator RpfG family c-di-GMP phosphodiesterase